MLERFGMQLDGGRGIMLIPLLGDLTTEIKVEPTQMDRNALLPIADQAMGRLKLVAAKLFEQYSANFITKAAFEAAWLFLQGRLKNALLKYAGTDLARQNLIR